MKCYVQQVGIKTIHFQVMRISESLQWENIFEKLKWAFGRKGSMISISYQKLCDMSDWVMKVRMEKKTTVDGMRDTESSHLFLGQVANNIFENCKFTYNQTVCICETCPFRIEKIRRRNHFWWFDEKNYSQKIIKYCVFFAILLTAPKAYEVYQCKIWKHTTRFAFYRWPKFCRYYANII